MSQAKVSRIERGVNAPNPADTETLARILGADEPTVQELIKKAQTLDDKLTDWRPASVGLSDTQYRVKKWETEASELREFQVALLSGLLQTSGYARAVISNLQRMFQENSEQASESAVASAVSARIQRQETLTDRTKTFHFVFMESALNNIPCSTLEMLAQIDHIRNIRARHENVTIGIITTGATLTIPPMHGFCLFDNTILAIDSYHTGLISRGRTNLTQYRVLFDYLAGQSTTDVDQILDKYQRQYLQQLQ